MQKLWVGVRDNKFFVFFNNWFIDFELKWYYSFTDIYVWIIDWV